MKTKILLLMAFFLVSSSLFESCKKREQPRFRWSWWKLRDTHFIMANSWKSYEGIEKNIENGRTTTGIFYWEPDTLIMNGPAGYTSLIQKASTEWGKAINNNLMPDTTKLTELGEIIRGLKLFLDERQDHDAGKAWNIIKLAIPRKLYKTYPHFWEMLLTALKEYYTVTVGGSAEYTDGIRNLQQEINICNLITAPDPDDPWGYTCSALTHYEAIFRAMAEGDNKAMKVGLARDVEGDIIDITMDMNQAQNMEAEKRFKLATNQKGYAVGSPEDYKTKFEDDSNGGYYYLGLDVRQLKGVVDKPTY